jgi:hypothetical protein
MIVLDYPIMLTSDLETEDEGIDEDSDDQSEPAYSAVQSTTF